MLQILKYYKYSEQKILDVHGTSFQRKRLIVIEINNSHRNQQTEKIEADAR